MEALRWAARRLGKGKGWLLMAKHQMAERKHPSYLCVLEEVELMIGVVSTYWTGGNILLKLTGRSVSPTVQVAQGKKGS